MTEKERARRRRPGRYAPYYRRKFAWAKWCIYCGSTKKLQRDHVLPLYQAERLDIHNPATAYRLRRAFVTVPACASCNQTGGRTYAASILQKRIYIQGRLLDRYRDLCMRIATQATRAVPMSDTATAAYARELRALHRRLTWPGRGPRAWETRHIPKP